MIKGMIVLLTLSGPVPGVLQATHWAKSYTSQDPAAALAECRADTDKKADELNGTVPPGVVWTGVCFRPR
jgi:hypothetical protein